MSLSNLSLASLLTGLLAIAGVLAILQLLRVRHRRVDVVTTMFWKEAIEESRARVLIKRFRHPWAYLLALSIAALIWWALAEPQTTASNQREHIVLLDASAAMQAGDRFAHAVKALHDQIGRLPRDHRRVFWCGSDHRLLLDRGEETILLGARLKGRRPDPGPASIDDFMTTHLQASEKPTMVYVFGSASVSSAVRNLLPDSVTVGQVRASRSRDQALNNAGIVAIGVGEAQSGRYDRVDVYVRTHARGGAEPAVVSLEIGGEPWGAGGIELAAQEWVFRDLPATGEILTVRMSGVDDLAIDNQAQVALPLREAIRVQVSEAFRGLLEPILQADAAIEIVDSNPQVIMGQIDQSSGVPSLRLVPRDTQDAAFVLGDRWPNAHVRSSLEETFRKLGIDQIDTTSLASNMATIIQLDAEESDVRQVSVWSELFSADYNLVQSSAFPLFIAKTARWLANTSDLVPYVAVGESHEALQFAGASFAPPVPGSYQTTSGESVMAALVTPLGTAASAEGDSETTLAIASTNSGKQWMTLLVLLALALLLFEWGFFQKGWIP